MGGSGVYVVYWLGLFVGWFEVYGLRGVVIFFYFVKVCEVVGKGEEWIELFEGVLIVVDFVDWFVGSYLIFVDCDWLCVVVD